MAEQTAKEVTLTVYERLILTNRVLPSEGGSFREAMRVRKLRNRLELTEEEKEAIEYSVQDRIGPVWNATKAQDADVKFKLTEGEVEVIALGFKQIEEEGKVPTGDQFMDLYEKFEEDVNAIEV